MIKRLLVCRSRGSDPYENLALEEALLNRVGEGEIILYLWQNERTVVIGRNQNPWKECRTALLAEEGGHLARRLSGGGAVFHDLGNLNFTFLMREEDYDLARQLSVIESACRSLGIPVERSGRNDLLADGRKFSGNAFCHHKGRAYHHGTLMVDVDMERVNRYLSPSRAKLAAKGVDSVRSRVVNLREFVPELTVDQLADALIDAMAEVYAVAAHSVRHNEASGIRHQASGDGGRESPVTSHQSPGSETSAAAAIGRTPEATGSRQKSAAKAFPLRAELPGGQRDFSASCRSCAPGNGILNGGRCPSAHTGADEVVPAERINPEEFDLRDLRAKYASGAWLYGQKLPFTLSVEDRFPWGGIELQLQVNEGVIQAARVYTDAMDETLAPRLETAFSCCPLRLPVLQSRLEELSLPETQMDHLLSLLEKSL